MIQITKEPIRVIDVLDSVSDDRAGGIDLFLGSTRNNSRGKTVVALEYSAYEPMALREMKRIEEEARRQWDLIHIAMVHRLGRLEIGEVSVAIAVSAPHRREAFEACRYLIDTLKKTIPIWKKELFEDGEAWVEGQEVSNVL